jgi:hypothetical protein
MDVSPTINTEYSSYLQSQAWRIARNRALRMARFRCQRCQSRVTLQVHHKTYERLGHERDDDLEVLCESCHHGHHVDEKSQQGTQYAIYIKLAMDVYRDEPYDSIASLAGAVKDACFRLDISYDEHQVDRALAFVTKNLTFRKTEPESVQRDLELATSAPPCVCPDCVAAGVSHRRLHRDPRSLEWLHGESLRRWHDARDHFRAALAAANSLIRTMPDVPTIDDNYEADAEKANQIRQQGAAMLRGEL